MRKILTLVAVPAVLSMALVAPATARPSSATLTVTTVSSGAQATSSAPTVGSSLVFGGCGYVPGAGVNLTVVGPTATTFVGEMADADGCFSTADTMEFVVRNAGTYNASSYQSSRRKADANIAFTVS